MGGDYAVVMCSCYSARLPVCLGGGASEGFGGNVNGSDSVVPAYAVDTARGRGKARDVVLVSVPFDSFAVSCVVDGANTTVRVTCEESGT